MLMSGPSSVSIKTGKKHCCVAQTQPFLLPGMSWEHLWAVIWGRLSAKAPGRCILPLKSWGAVKQSALLFPLLLLPSSLSLLLPSLFSSCLADVCLDDCNAILAPVPIWPDLLSLMVYIFFLTFCNVQILIKAIIKKNVTWKCRFSARAWYSKLLICAQAYGSSNIILCDLDQRVAIAVEREVLHFSARNEPLTLISSAYFLKES